jgi:hypothetical protein
MTDVPSVSNVRTGSLVVAAALFEAQGGSGRFKRDLAALSGSEACQLFRADRREGTTQQEVEGLLMLTPSAVLPGPGVRARRARRRLIVAGLGGLVVVGACAGPSGSPVGGSVHAQTSSQASTPVDARRVTAATVRYLSNIYSPAIANVRAVLVTVDRRPVVQIYRGATAAQTHDVHSVTKSVVGTLIGLALSENKLHSLDDTLATLLPEHRKEMGTTVAGIPFASS